MQPYTADFYDQWLNIERVKSRGIAEKNHYPDPVERHYRTESQKRNFLVIAHPIQCPRATQYRGLVSDIVREGEVSIMRTSRINIS